MEYKTRAHGPWYYSVCGCEILVNAPLSTHSPGNRSTSSDDTVSTPLISQYSVLESRDDIWYFSIFEVLKLKKHCVRANWNSEDRRVDRGKFFDTVSLCLGATCHHQSVLVLLYDFFESYGHVTFCTLPPPTWQDFVIHFRFQNPPEIMHIILQNDQNIIQNRYYLIATSSNCVSSPTLHQYLGSFLDEAGFRTIMSGIWQFGRFGVCLGRANACIES